MANIVQYHYQYFLVIAYLLLYILLNEKSDYNLISKKWLIDNKFISNENNYLSNIEKYKNKFNDYNS